MEFYKLINKEITKKYGIDSYGKPLYQLVQNYNLTEKRRAKAEYLGVELLERIPLEVPKYSYIPDGYWILEKLFYTDNPELQSNFTYEPLWVFKTVQGEYQAPNLQACIFIIESALRGPQPLETDNERKRKEAAIFYEMLGGNADIGEKIGTGEGVSYSGLDAKTSEPEVPVQTKD